MQEAKQNFSLDTSAFLRRRARQKPTEQTDFEAPKMPKKGEQFEFEWIYAFALQGVLGNNRQIYTQRIAQYNDSTHEQTFK